MTLTSAKNNYTRVILIITAIIVAQGHPMIAIFILSSVSIATTPMVSILTPRFLQYVAQGQKY